MINPRTDKSLTDEFQLDAIDALSKYGMEEYEQEADRVQLAIVSLCEGNLNRLKDLVAEAKKDYRNILYWNEQSVEFYAKLT